MQGARDDKLWRVWLVCVLSLYPAYWLVSFLLFAAPALTRVAFTGQTLTSVNVSLQGITASSTTSDPAPMRRGPGSPSIPLALGITLALALLARRQPIFAGVIIAMVGAEGLPFVMMRVAFGNRWTTENLLGLVIFFAILCFGLRSMLNVFQRDSYWA